MRMAIIDLALPHGVSSVADIVSASFGVHTTTSEKDILPDTLIDCADKALNQAKAQGRNRVVSYKDSTENQD
jgi:PleD family two-component response regulator